jgi:hypothetical protein
MRIRIQGFLGKVCKKFIAEKVIFVLSKIATYLSLGLYIGCI